jgi:cysteine desulfurase
VSGRVYLDWNATAPLRAEARAAMLAAMDAVGNPSSVHAEGRAARALVEKAREQVARLAGVAPETVFFCSGATEANAMALRPATVTVVSATAHDSLLGAARFDAMASGRWAVDADGRHSDDPCGVTSGVVWHEGCGAPDGSPSDEWFVGLCVANGETGVLNPPGSLRAALRGRFVHLDVAQAAGRIPLAIAGLRAGMDGRAGPLCVSAAMSAHKLGGPMGVGALVATDPRSVVGALMTGGGQERGVRPGTHNVAGIAGFGAAAEAALRDLQACVWDRVARLRDSLEERLVAAAPDAIIVGAAAPRLPNTTCVAVPGWRGETQVIAMDLAGFGVSAGAACSSGKTGSSRALRAMGLDEITAGSAIRVSLGPTTTEDEIARFADAWRRAYSTRRPAAA